VQQRKRTVEEYLPVVEKRGNDELLKRM